MSNETDYLISLLMQNKAKKKMLERCRRKENERYSR